ncbi:hypothetical protein [Oryzobacter terrae]|uniref:hypothetical protein n=1 Tax=Oryzobacter terrae TaxID=1620385 RepID=UPI00366E31DD
MWLWGTLLAVVVVLAVIGLVVQRRRGPSDTSDGTDFNVTNRSGAGHDGQFNGPISGAGG